ncbi:MAG: PepSY domain-containing protein [Bacteriovoracaceae bacterium]|jgi:hypothetical protein|nr:PepSY domain-containing protein [Bacteriovoracaceae bacterium]
MNRLTLIKIHLYFSGLTLIFMSLMALSGSLHFLIGDEAEDKALIKSINVTQQINKNKLKDLFIKELTQIDSTYQYDYIKGSKSSLMSRPTTRTYYTIHLQNTKAKIHKHEPSLRKTLMELHKGHGARVTRFILGILGIAAIGAALSGLWLGLSSKAFRKITILTTVSGIIIYLGLLLI